MSEVMNVGVMNVGQSFKSGFHVFANPTYYRYAISEEYDYVSVFLSYLNLFLHYVYGEENMEI